MKIHKELLELSRKAEKIIYSSMESIEFNRDIWKSFKEKAMEIMACKTLEDLKKLSKVAEPKKKHSNFDIPLEESKVHLHSNKSSFASTSGSSCQNNADNSSELEKEEISEYKKNGDYSHVNTGRKFEVNDLNSKDDSLETETNSRNEFAVKNLFSETSQQNSNADNLKGSKSQNFVKFNNFHSSTVKTSSGTSTSKDIDGIYSTRNFVFEKHQNINIMEKIEENHEEIISEKYVTVSTMIKKSYSKSPKENSEEILQNNGDPCDKKSCSSTYQHKELHHGLSNINIFKNSEENDKGMVSQKVVTVSTRIKTSHPKSYKHSKDIIEIERGAYEEHSNSGNDNFKQIHLDLPAVRMQVKGEKTDNIWSNNTDFAVSNEPKLTKTSCSGNRTPQNIEFVEYNGENQSQICNPNFLNKTSSDIHSNANGNETNFSSRTLCSPEEIVENLQTGNVLVSSKVSDAKGTGSITSDNLKSGITSETDDLVLFNRARDHAEVNEKKKKILKKKFILAKNFQGISAIPVLLDNKQRDGQNSNKMCPDGRTKRKMKENGSPLPKKCRNYNLRSGNNYPTEKRDNENWKKCPKLDFNKSIIEKVEEKKRVREQKMKLTRQRRENLERARRERLRLKEERRRKRFEQHEEILKKKIMDVKNKAKCRKLSRRFTYSSEATPDNGEPQSLQTGFNKTYLVENLNDISPIEPATNIKDRSSGEGLNYSLLYNSSFDKKIFMRQSVVLTDIAQLMPANTIQNCLHTTHSKETETICRKTPNTTTLSKVGKRKLSSFDNSPRAPVKKPMRSTRKISASPNIIKTDKMKKGTIGISSDSAAIKLTSQQITQEKDSSVNSNLQGDPNLSMETYVVLKNRSSHKNEGSVYLEIKTSDEAKKAKAVALCRNISSVKPPKISATSPLVVLKDISNVQSNHSRLTNDRSKAAKVSVPDNGIENDPKLSVLKPGVVLKDVIKSKPYIQIKSKKLEKDMKKTPNNYKRKGQGKEKNKPRKKLLVANEPTKKQNKHSYSSSKKDLSSDVTSYEISDISDTSINIVEPKNKKIPTWASNIHLKQALFKQYYEPPDTDAIFGNFKNQKAIDLAEIFTPDKPQYHNRTSSAKWSADESPI